mmetsp:Transcript_100411/g.304665  ORF Transcript_100411/g.304665 Transcript_100411/m.304665 type:complete len:293 (-) Transcript_100411:57-935(-)
MAGASQHSAAGDASRHSGAVQVGQRSTAGDLSQHSAAGNATQHSALGANVSQRSAKPSEAPQPLDANASRQMEVEEVDAVQAFSAIGNESSAMSSGIANRTNVGPREPENNVQQFHMSGISDASSEPGEASAAVDRRAPQALSMHVSEEVTPIQGLGRDEVTDVSSFQSAGGQQQFMRPSAQGTDRNPAATHTAVQELSVNSASDDDDEGPVGGWGAPRVIRPAPKSTAASGVRNFQDRQPMNNSSMHDSGIKPFSPTSVSSMGSRARDPSPQQQVRAFNNDSIGQLLEESM